MAKKKENPLKFFNDERDKRVKKMQKDGKTPFQIYMTNPGATASDTIPQRNEMTQKVLNAKAKNPKNQKALEEAYEKTFGMDIKNRYMSNLDGTETLYEYLRRMGPNNIKQKKGGSVKKG